MRATTPAGLRLRGTEAWTVELTGTVAAPQLGALRGVEPIERDGTVEVGLLVLAMRGLGLRRLPGPGSDYCEALWRLGVRIDGAPGWLAHTCDLDRPLVRWLGRRLIRYPVRTAAITLDERDERWNLEVSAAVHAEGAATRTGERASLRLGLLPTSEEPPPEPPRPVIVIDGGRTYAVPWAEDPAPFRRVAAVVEIDDTLSLATLGAAIRWDPTALVHRGRTHHCGFATCTEIRTPPSATRA